MEFTVISSLDDWQKLQAEWDALLDNSALPSPFLTYTYQRLWWQSAGGGEWSSYNRQLCIVIARENGQVLGIAPLFAWEDEDDHWRLGFIGQVDVSDYLDFIVPQKDLERFLYGLLEFIAQSDELPAKELKLANILDKSPSTTLLTQVAQAQGWHQESEILELSPYIPLPESWDAYLAQLDKKQRHEIRRKLRNAEKRATIELAFVSDPMTIEENSQYFLKLMRQNALKAKFLTPAMAAFFNNFIKETFQQGDLQFSWLTINGKRAASFLSFIKDKKLFVYNTAWNPDFASYSPGWLLLAKLIDWAISQNFQEVDMMRGDEVYKYRFGGIDRHVLHFKLYPPKNS